MVFTVFGKMREGTQIKWVSQTQLVNGENERNALYYSWLSHKTRPYALFIKSQTGKYASLSH